MRDGCPTPYYLRFRLRLKEKFKPANLKNQQPGFGLP